MHSKGVHIPQPIQSELSRLCPESYQPGSPAGALAGRADQPRYRSERDPAARPDAPRPRKGQRGPNAGKRGAPGRRIGAPRNRGPHGRQRGRRARETPGNVWDAKLRFAAQTAFRRRRDVRRPNDQAGENDQAGRVHADQPPATKEPRAARADGRG